MQTALVYAASAIVRDRLNEQLIAVQYAVDCAVQTGDITVALKHEGRDVLIAEARKDNFAHLMRLAFVHNRQTIIHFFEEKNVFCFYPMQRQPVKLVMALRNAGLRLSPRLLLNTQKIQDEGEAIPSAMVEI